MRKHKITYPYFVGHIQILRVVFYPMFKWEYKKVEAVCFCGNVFTCDEHSLRKGNTKSCGCTRPGYKYSPIYRTWCGLRQRCNNKKNKAYPNYGGRGITVSKEWGSFKNFLSDMGDTYSPGLELDRRDNNQGYSKENCRWVTLKENNRNKRNTLFLDGFFPLYLFSDVGEKFGISKSSILSRITYKYNLERMISKPIRGKESIWDLYVNEVLTSFFTVT